MILNFHWFQVEIAVERRIFAPRHIRRRVAAIAATGNKLSAIKQYRELMAKRGVYPTLMQAKIFVESLEKPNGNP